MKLIVGLGNPGKNYEKTRHNLGFMAIDYYANLNNLTFKEKNNYMFAETIINNEKVILLKPLTYMNLSGDAVISLVNYYNIDLENILIVYDDKDFEVGKFKIKKGGTSGGHNGIDDILKKLHTSDIARLRIGISKNNCDLVDYVLSRFSKEELEILNNMMPIICSAIEDFVKYDIEKIMTKYNSKE